MTDRAVSVTVNYVMTLTIATLLLSGLVVSAGGLIESESERAIESELEVLGQQLAADVESAGRLAVIDEGPDTEVEKVEIETRLPERVAGTGYMIDIEKEQKVIQLRSTDPEIDVQVRFTLPGELTAETEQTVRGGNVLIEWNGNDTLVVKSA